jgi:hypothetical protein
MAEMTNGMKCIPLPSVQFVAERDCVQGKIAVRSKCGTTVNLRWGRLSDLQFIEVVFTSYSRFLLLLSKIGIVEGSSILIRVLCSLIANKKLQRETLHATEALANELFHINTQALGFKNKRAMAYQTLLTILYQNPAIISRFFERIFVSIELYRHVKLDPAFSLKLELSDVVELCRVLAKGMLISFLSEVVQINEERFMGIWPEISELVLKLIQTAGPEAINLFLTCCSIGFDESQISIITKSLEILDIERKRILEGQLLKILESDSSEIQECFPDLISAVAPSHCQNDSEMLATVFASLEIICRKHFEKMSNPEQHNVLAIVFEFVCQAEKTWAISALGLLREILQKVGKFSRFWRRILGELLTAINDQRQEVSEYAIETFFSLLKENKTQIPNDIYDYLIVDCFLPLLMTFAEEIQKIALVEMAEIACLFWDEFTKNSQFKSTFWSLLIEKQQSFVSQCQNLQVRRSRLRFYEIVLDFERLDEQIRDQVMYSFSQVASSDLLMSLIPDQKKFLTKSRLETWLQIIEQLSSVEAFKASLLFFPINPEFGSEIAKTILKIVTENTESRALMFHLLSSIWIRQIPDEQLLTYLLEVKSIFTLPESVDFSRILLDMDFRVSGETAADFFELLISSAARQNCG